LTADHRRASARTGVQRGTRHASRPSRAALVLLVLLGLVGGACTSSGPDAVPTDDDTATTDVDGEAIDDGAAAGDDVASDVVVPTPPVADLVPSLVLASTDGTAFDGSRTVFTMTDTTTGESFLVPVTGQGESTRLELAVPPGTYRVTSGGRQVSPTASSAVAYVNPEEFTVAAVDLDEGVDQLVTVEFGLEVETSPFDLRIESLTEDRVELSWQALGDADIAEYVLRQTAGTDAAAEMTDGVSVDLGASTTTKAVVTGLQADSDYTFTLFASDSSGASLPPRSVSATTATLDGSVPAYALAPNTIVATDVAALAPESIGPSLVRIALDPANLTRHSSTVIPGVDPAELAGGCVVGMPVLVPFDVAGDDAFHGLIESCGDAPRALRAGTAPTGATAVVNTDVPLAAVIPYLHLRDAQVHRCIDDSGNELGAGASLCESADTDGDGVSDKTEAALGLDPDDASDGWDSWTAPARGPVGGAADAPPVTDLEAPDDLGTGVVQVTLLWATGDDLDLHVTDPDGNEISYRNETSPTGGRLDTDDLGDDTCRSTDTRAENVFWDQAAPDGLYTVRVDAFSAGGDAQCTDGPQARLQVRVDGVVVVDRTVTAGVDDPVTFVVGPPPPLVQVDVTWATPDDLDLLVTTGPDVPQSTPGGGAASPGSDCQPVDEQSLTEVPLDAQPGTYHVVVTDFAGRCGQSVNARVEVRVRGVLVVRQDVAVPSGGASAPITFVVEDTEPTVAGWRGQAAPVPAGFVGIRAAAAPKVDCKLEGKVIPTNGFEPNFGFDEFHRVDMTLKVGELKWDIEAGASTYINPNIKVEGGVTCSLDIDGVTFQLMTTPVPVNLELAPIIEGGATGSFALEGPKLELTFGVSTQGFVNASMETCGWFEIPCGVELDTYATARPIGDFSVGPAKMTVEGELSLGVGIEATLGVGVKNTFVTAKTGIAVSMKPLVGKLKASVSVATPDLREREAIAPWRLDRTEDMDAFFAEWGTIAFDATSLDCPNDRPATRVTAVLQRSGLTSGYHCSDAVCLDPLRSGPIYTPWSDCDQARCYGSAHLIKTESAATANRTITDREIYCWPLADASAGGASASGNPFSLCAGVSIGAELAVDLRAETFVLGWGKDRRYGIWKGEYDYAGAEFNLGDCD
jgi:hypothetical protein